MADCEVCGRSNAQHRAEIEGSVMTVCELCASLGKLLDPQSKERGPGMLSQQLPSRMPKLGQSVRSSEAMPREDMANVVKQGREKLGLTQQELSRRLQLKDNTIRRVEGGWQPPSDTVRRLEGFLKMSLTEGGIDSFEMRRKIEKKMMTLGDVANK